MTLRAHREDQSTFSKVLVRYNPKGMRVESHAGRALKRLSDYLLRARRASSCLSCSCRGEAQLAKVNGDKKAYDRDIRPH